MENTKFSGCDRCCSLCCIYTTTSSFIFELTGTPDKIDGFVALMREVGLVEVGRTGIVGMIRGAKA